jgi:hypothetical protein
MEFTKCNRSRKSRAFKRNEGFPKEIKIPARASGWRGVLKSFAILGKATHSDYCSQVNFMKRRPTDYDTMCKLPLSREMGCNPSSDLIVNKLQIPRAAIKH